jgi:hypothetical protein
MDIDDEKLKIFGTYMEGIMKKALREEREWSQSQNKLLSASFAEGLSKLDGRVLMLESESPTDTSPVIGSNVSERSAPRNANMQASQQPPTASHSDTAAAPTSGPIGTSTRRLSSLDREIEEEAVESSSNAGVVSSFKYLYAAPVFKYNLSLVQLKNIIAVYDMIAKMNEHEQQHPAHNYFGYAGIEDSARITLGEHYKSADIYALRNASFDPTTLVGIRNQELKILLGSYNVPRSVPEWAKKFVTYAKAMKLEAALKNLSLQPKASWDTILVEFRRLIPHQKKLIKMLCAYGGLEFMPKIKYTGQDKIPGMLTVFLECFYEHDRDWVKLRLAKLQQASPDIMDPLKASGDKKDYHPETAFYVILDHLLSGLTADELYYQNIQQDLDAINGTDYLQEEISKARIDTGRRFGFRPTTKVNFADSEQTVSYFKSDRESIIEEHSNETYHTPSSSPLKSDVSAVHTSPQKSFSSPASVAVARRPQEKAPVAHTPLKATGVCLSMLRPGGACMKTNCPYKHTFTPVEAAAAVRENIRQMCLSQYADKAESSTILKLLEHSVMNYLNEDTVESYVMGINNVRSDLALVEAAQRIEYEQSDEIDGPFQSTMDAQDPSDFSVVETQSDLTLILSTALEVHQVGIETSALPSVEVDAVVGLPDDKLLSQRMILDSGCKPTSVIPKHILDENPTLNSIFKPNRTYASMANRTTAVCYGTIELPVSITNDFATYKANVVFTVMDMPGGVPLIGLFDICHKFLDLFIVLLKNIKAALGAAVERSRPEEKPPPSASVHFISVNSAELTYPWTEPVETVSPEEEDTPMPASYEGPLYHLSKPWDEVHKEYVASLIDHVDPEFHAAHPEFLEYLKSDDCVAVFLPKEWTGLIRFPPVELEFLDTFPKVLRAPPRHFNPKLQAVAYEEFKRLRQYFYEPSASTTASPMVLAPKATAPFVRFCIDLREINKYVLIPQDHFKNVRHELDKAIKFRIFFDLDAANAFHQIIIGYITRARLSVQTPWGHFQPRFLPEGVGPASGLLQKYVSEIFMECEEWLIVIHDNFLVCAYDYADGIEKMKKVIAIAKYHCLVLKMAKSWFGKKTVSFFGYEVTHGSYTLSKERRDQVTAIPFPVSLLHLQRFLGAAMYFKPFVRNYAILTARLTEMTKKEFVWDRSTWTYNYEADVEAFKLAILDCQRVYLADYAREWVVQTDASNYGVGSVLLQLVPDPADSSQMIQQVIAYASSKFSPQAFRWDLPKKEAYALYFAVKSFSYYLYGGKSFILETDHKNLLWMEQSIVPIVIRWRILLQSFSFLLRHIPGKSNVTADALSRIFALFELHDPDSNEAWIAKAHNARNGHWGVHRTWLLLGEIFPGHSIPVRAIQDFIAACPTCQKIRFSNKNYSIEPSVRNIKVSYPWSRIAVDRLAISPVSKSGNNNIVVVVEVFSGVVHLYPTRDYTADTLASVLCKFVANNGVFDELSSDPGSDLMSHSVKLLNEWLGLHHVVSLVDRHESNGAERKIQEVLRHLRAIVFDLHLKNRWDEDHVLPLVQHVMNSTVSAESGFRPFDIKYGTLRSHQFRLPAAIPSDMSPSDFIRLLDEDLRRIRELVSDRHAALITKRRGEERPQNKFQPGDFVLHRETGKDKLTFDWYGPLKVIKQRNNDVTARHMATDVPGEYHVSRLKLFVGTEAQARETAMRDQDQYTIVSILNYRGNPLRRSETLYLVLFADGERSWVPYSKDIADTAAFGLLISSRPELHILNLPTKSVSSWITALKKVPIDQLHVYDPSGRRPHRTWASPIQPGVVAYVDLRYWSDDGHNWYFSLGLPLAETHLYVVTLLYTSWADAKHTSIYFTCPLFDSSSDCANTYDVFAHGSRTAFNSDTMVLVDEALAVAYPEILPKSSRTRLLRRYKTMIASFTP